MKSKGEILSAILNVYRNCYFFLHNTREQEIVDKILGEGFIFENQLAHSTDRVNPSEPIEITYFLLQRKDYGPFTIIIGIPKLTYDNYSALAAAEGTPIEEILTIRDVSVSENDELTYTLSPKHIIGYFNNKTGEFYQNRQWDPHFSNSRSGKPRRQTRNRKIL
jgi:hypothetical protein